MSQVKYKCKKSYPGGPIVGHILNPQDTWFAGMNYWWNNVWFDPKDYTEYWELVKDPIFVSEDGIKMFLGDEYFAVYSTWLYDKFNVSASSPINHTKNFSSRELAEKYIFENKPQFSKKDMIEFAKYHSNNVKFDGEPHLEYWMNHVKK